MYLAFKFMQDSENNNGLIARHYPPASKLTESRISFQEAIEASGNVDNSVTEIAYNNYPQIESYVQHCGETPIGNPIGAFIQAAFLRLNQIAYVSKATDSPEYEALTLIEDDETELKQINSAEGDYVMSSDVQAAIVKTVEEIKRLRYKYGQSPSLVDVIKDCCINCDVKDLSFFDYFGDVTQGDPLYNKEYWNDMSQQRALLYPDSKNNFDGSGVGTVFSELEKLIRGVKDAVQTTASDIATESLKDALIRNIPIILLILVLIGIVIYFAVYAGNKKA